LEIRDKYKIVKTCNIVYIVIDEYQNQHFV